MAPVDFMDFRGYLSPASGFQSVQFRLLENKLGVKNELRTNYGKSHYLKIFEDQKTIDEIKQSEREPSLCDLIQRWLERTPGLGLDNVDHAAADDTNTTTTVNASEANAEGMYQFWSSYGMMVERLLDANAKEVEAEQDPTAREALADELKRKRELFDTIFDVAKHNALVARGERRFSHAALQGALLISMYREEPRFNQPFNILNLLMDIDALITKWRCKLLAIHSRFIFY